MIGAVDEVRGMFLRVQKGRVLERSVRVCCAAAHVILCGKSQKRLSSLKAKGVRVCETNGQMSPSLCELFCPVDAREVSETGRRRAAPVSTGSERLSFKDPLQVPEFLGFSVKI